MTLNPETGVLEMATWIDGGKEGYHIIFPNFFTYTEEELIKLNEKYMDEIKTTVMVEQILDLIKMSKQPTVDFESLLITSYARGFQEGAKVMKESIVENINNPPKTKL